VVAAHVGLLGIVLGAMYLMIYRGGSEGQALKPGAYLEYSAAARPYHHALGSPLAFGATVLAALLVPCALLLPLGGAALVRERWWPRLGRSTPELLLICTLAASLIPFVLLGIPGDSQAYFLVYGFLAAIAVSAAGIVGFARRLTPWARELVRPTFLLGAGTLAVVLGLVVEPSHAPLVPGYAVAAQILSGSVWMARSRLRAAMPGTAPGLFNLGALALVALTLADLPVHVLLPALERVAQGLPAARTAGVGQRELTAGLYRGLVWLRAHSNPRDVLAVNNHHLEGRTGVGSSRYFDYSAFAERRVFLESWDYTPQGARHLAQGRDSTPFPALLALNEAAVQQASPSATETLYRRYGVRYILIDRLHGPVPPIPPSPARLVYANRDLDVYRLLDPAGTRRP
jgi:hypothetical protein